MKERPIIFSSPMIRAIFDGRKTMTRRPLKLKDFGRSNTPGYEWTYRDKRMLWNDVNTELLLSKCPYGIPGDRLWVKETWGKHKAGIDSVVYRADSENQRDKIIDNKWKSPRFMPRWASRLTLEITDIRVERLQDISEGDSGREGSYYGVGAGNWRNARHIFQELWDSIYGNFNRWDFNPWVWVIEFRRLPWA